MEGQRRSWGSCWNSDPGAIGLGQGLEPCISNTLSGDTQPAGPWTTLWEARCLPPHAEISSLPHCPRWWPFCIWAAWVLTEDDVWRSWVGVPSSCKCWLLWRLEASAWSPLLHFPGLLNTQSDKWETTSLLYCAEPSFCKFLKDLYWDNLDLWKSCKESPESPPPLTSSVTQHHLTEISYKTTVQFSSVAQSCSTLCNPANHSTPGLPVHHQLPEFTQTHVHWVGDAFQPSYPVVPFSSCSQSFPAAGSFQMSQLFAPSGQSIGVSALASVLPMNTQAWSPLGWTGWISLQSKGLSRVFSNTTVQKHQFFGAQLSL